ncbi:hypothetical protein UFOVP1393_46 [uncultured Caudovirales phage]|uniref:Uncharacterized protein n=1 Tax=uncultured Caudovirales phage TaxID=2100421 RepID=A0A6J5S761_9CAUD|nr:hypothetical protein UFOVP1393_46 [uncultured Caudovirales phage]
MAISYSALVDIRGQAVDPVISEIIFENKTISEGLVAFETGIKAGTIFSENSNSVVMQSWAVNPSASGTIGINDVLITPVKVEYLDAFTPNDLRTSRFNRDMKPGAWNDVSDEFAKMILNGVAKSISADAENKFWNGATSATKTAVAALTAGTLNTQASTQEKALVAAMPTNLLDSVITRAIYNNAAVGGRIKVVGTAAITASTIVAQYQLLYTSIVAETLSASEEKAFIYAPRSHKQLINIANVNLTYRDVFSVDMVADKYYYLGVEIKFVPIAENVMLVAVPSSIKWCTDLMEDLNMVVIDKYPQPRKDYFYDVVFTIFAHVTNQKFNTLYVG